VRYRHPIDLYGVKNGLGKFCPIMVENINKIPDIYMHEDPEVIKQIEKDEQRQLENEQPKWGYAYQIPREPEPFLS